MASKYKVQNPRTTTTPSLTNYPWFISTCSNGTDASRILESCRTIENGNFFVRQSESKNAKYTISLWFNNTPTHVRINKLDDEQFQLEFKPNSMTMPTFSKLIELIDFYTEHDIKLTGHCQGFIKLKFNPNILDYLNSQGGAVSYAS